MLEITARDWHINQKRVPLPDSDEYEDYYAYQEELCKNGCMIDGVYINQYLYWHLNFWGTEVDYVDERGFIQQSYSRPLLRDNEWLIFSAIYEAERQRKGLAIGGCRRLGKDLLNSSTLYYADREGTIGDAKVGDRIYDRNGKLTTITGVFPQGKRPVYKMVLGNGQELYCGLDHNWIVRSGSGVEEVLTTRDLISSFDTYGIPLNKPVLYDDCLLECDLYDIGIKVGNQIKCRRDGFTISPYLKTSVSDRWRLVVGLMDTVGFVDEKTGIALLSCYDDLFLQDFYNLVRSLGVYSFIDKENKNVGLVTKNKLFTSCDLNNLVVDCENDLFDIISIEYVFDDYTTCIMVDNEGRDFLTDGYTVTHNSVFESSYIGHGLTFDQDSQNVIAGLNSGDIKLITDKIDKGLNHLPEYFQWQRIEDDWKKQVTFGAKDSKNRKFPFSAALVRNLDDGNNEEAIAGTKPRKLIIDEALHEHEVVLNDKDEWICMRDVKVGDRIYDHNGELTSVLRKVDVGVRDLWEIVLADGRTIRSCDNHNWKVWNQHLKRYVYVKTKDIRKKYFFEKYDKRYGKKSKSYIFSVPNNLKINRTEKELPIDPYWLGLWLGDGISTDTCVCSIDDEIVNYCIDYGEKLNMSVNVKRDFTKPTHNFRYVSIVDKQGRKNKLIELLRELNLFDNKHIPDIYLKSSFNQKSELLRGLLDTDGTIDLKGRISFSTSNVILKENLCVLLREMGYSFIVREEKTHYLKNGKRTYCKNTFRFHIKSGDNLFGLKRKRERFYDKKVNSNTKKRLSGIERSSIVDVKYFGKAQAYCIEVDNDEHLFLTTNYVVTGNCAKGPFLAGLIAARPGFTTMYGWLCSPIMTFTGGDMERYHDAKKLFENPEAYNFLTFEYDEKPGKKYGLFLGRKYRQEGKVESTLANYLGLRSDALDELPMLVSDADKSELVTKRDLDSLKEAGDLEAYLKEQMYFPSTIDEMFANLSGNVFNPELSKQQMTHIERSGIKPMLVELEMGIDGTITHKTSKKAWITEYPVQKQSKDAPIAMWEPPVDNPPMGLYIAGVDPYRQGGDSAHSNSLGAVYIFKRLYNILKGGYTYSFVASYVARPDDKDYWNEQARLLIKYYNAYALCENDELSFIDYMKNKGDAIKHLAPQPNWLKMVSPFSTQKRDFGISRSSERVRNHLHSIYKKYQEEELDVDENGIKYLGISRINDTPLLLETMVYDGDMNVDRIIAAELALCLANDMDHYIKPETHTNQDKRMQSYGKSVRKASRNAWMQRNKSSIIKSR